jgi:uncharacterized SAM-binding protein YcdF (DUF218 family)
MQLTSATPSRAKNGYQWIWFLLGAFVLYLGVQYARVGYQARSDETRPADAIVVFGAAEYSGKPSPVYRARLDHAQTLFARGIAPIVITTGGAGGDPVHSEGEVGREYLIERGVPDKSLIAETQSDDTSESAERVAGIMRRNNMHTCVAVSDGYHLFRIKRMMERQGVTVYGAPRPENRPLSGWQKMRIQMKEVLSYTVWKLHLV